MDKIIAFDQGNSLCNFMPLPTKNSGGTSDENKVVSIRSNIEKKTL